jgi:hydroxyacylglutathione hydrolase
MNLLVLPAFADNDLWMLHDGARAVVMNPGDAAPVREALDRPKLELDRILVTRITMTTKTASPPSGRTRKSRC